MCSTGGQKLLSSQLDQSVQSKPLRINHIGKERGMAWEKEWKNILNYINVLSFKWHRRFLTCFTLMYEQLSVHINTVLLCPDLHNQWGLTPNVPDLKLENHLSSLHFIHLFMTSLNTYSANTYYMPCTRPGIKNTVVREIDPGDRPLGTYNVDSRGKNKH